MEVSRNSFTFKKLQTLDCPFTRQPVADNTDLVLSGNDFEKLVVWLEEEQIRFYSPSERAELRKVQDSTLWWKAAYKYCSELGIVFPANPIPGSAARKLAMLERLSNAAIQDVYLEKAASGCLTQMGVVEPSSVDSMMSGADLPEKDLSAALEAVNVMLRSASLPELSSTDPQDVTAALKCTRVRLERPMPHTDIPKLTRSSIDVPIGVNTDCKELRDVAAVLRLLHGGELRALQSNINSVITQLQAFTSDPKTDGKIGRVGH